MKPAELNPFKIGYGDEMIVFYPRMAMDAELDEVNKKFLDVSDTDELQYEKLFNIRLEAIAEFSALSPKRMTKEKGEIKYVELVDGAETTLDAMKRYFDKRTGESEKIIRTAYNAIINSMSPTIDFL